jgi:hypothetical protein
MLDGLMADWPIIYDTPEEELLIRLFNERKTRIELDLVGFESGELIFNVRVDDPKPLRLVK